MKFGILYNTDYYPEAHGSASQYYHQILEQAQFEEALGFDAVWFGEHHYSGYSFGSPPVIAMAAASRTKRIRLGTGVSLIPLNHPIRLAEEYAMLDVPGIPAEYDAGINRGLGVPSGFYHFAFEAGTEAALEEKRKELLAKGVQVTDIMDHDWAKSIYFKDPNGIQLEYCCYTRELNENDARMQDRFTFSLRTLGLDDVRAE